MNPKGSWSSFAFTVHTVFLLSCSLDSPLPTPVSYLGPRYLAEEPNDPRGKNVIESEFLPLVESFEITRGKRVSTPIYFANDLPKSVLGVCIVWKKDDVTLSEIKVNRKTYGRSGIESEMIIFHELGHCELGRPHTQELTRLEDGRIIPFSLMYPTLFFSSDYARFHEHYVIELFGRGGLLEKVGTDTLETSEEVEIIEKNGFDGYVYQ